jgi:molybdenum cofactor guanylyltransferase
MGSYISALILAGGKSTRMGRDKATIAWDGVPMLCRVYDVAIACTRSVCILTPWPDRYRDMLPPNCCWLEDSQPGDGPLVALAQGCQQLDCEWIWLLGCDLPRLQADVLQRWIEQLDRLPPDILALVPRCGDRWEPLCGFYRRSIASPLNAFVSGGGRSFQKWLPQLPVEPLSLSLDEVQMLHNCNRPEDISAVRYHSSAIGE